jgi:hypothetical protein
MPDIAPLGGAPVRTQKLNEPAAPTPQAPAENKPDDTFTLEQSARSLGTDLNQVDKGALLQLEQRAARTDAGLASQLDVAQAKVDAAAKELAPNALPTETAAQLQQKKAALTPQADAARAKVKAGESALATATAQKKTNDAEAAKAAAVVKKQDGRMLDGRGGVIANVEYNLQLDQAKADRMPEGKAKDAALADIASTQTRLEGFKKDLKDLTGAKATVAKCAETGAKLDQKIASAQGDITAGNAALDDVSKRSALLDKQITYAQAKAGAETVKKQLTQVRTVEGSLKSTETALDARDAAALKDANEVTNAAQEAFDHAKDMASNGSIRMYQEAAGIKKAVEDGKLKRKNVDMDRLDNNLDILGRQFQEAGQKREGTAREVVRQMQNPAFVQALSRMDDGERAKLVGRMMTSIEGTKTGEDFLKQALLPIAEGGPDGLAKLPEGKNPFAVIFKHGGAAGETAMTVLEKAGGFIAKQSKQLKNPELLDNLMKVSLALKPGQLKVVEDAAALANSGKMKDAKELLEAKGISAVAKNFERVSQSLTVVSGAAAYVELAMDPNLSTALEAAKGTAEMTKVATKFAQELPAFQKYKAMLGTTGKVADRVAAPIQAVIALHDTWKEDGSVQRGDVGETVGNSLVATGAIVTTAGLCLDGTVVGAVAGVPLNVFGTVMMGVGAGVNFIFGDNDTEKWLKKNAPQYLKY